jgi:hypothetical protein
MKAVTISVLLLWLAAGLSGSAAEPPAVAKPAPVSPATPGSAATGTPSDAPAKSPGTTPAAPGEAASEPDRIDPTEKVHSDTEISFPVDI